MKIILTLIFCFYSLTASALTTEQAETAKDTLVEMSRLTANGARQIQYLLKGEIETLTLIAEQKDNLIQRYQTLKQRLQTLYQELP